ncbi:PASTA domain-containing protein [bacterium]|nr:PASTA domain-containing protein [bacterium]MBU3956530.1 PASTA domain-containing protein [bacterium]
MKFYHYLIVIIISALISFASYVLISEKYLTVPEICRKASPVPDISGKSPEFAELFLASKNFKLNIAGQEFTAAGKKGMIFRQSPAAGSLLKSGKNIDAWVSGGAFSMAVPDVRGLSVGDAAEALSVCSLKPGSEQKENSNEIEEGKVIRTIPAASAWCERGAAIILVVSSGAEMTTVPNLKNKTLSQTNLILKSKNLVLGMVKKETNIDQRFDVILRQYPNPGAKVKQGTSITVVLNAESN